MNHEQFMKEVIREFKVCSLMTYKLSNNQRIKLRKWFFKKAKRHFKWNNWKCQKEWDEFCEAFDIKND